MESAREKKARGRTGCLTCRHRRIKCDEVKPECQRCHRSNVECLGYEQKRRAAVRRPLPLRELQPGRDIADGHSRDSAAQSCSVSSTLYEPDGLALVGLPSNPLPNQRPHHGARQILAYHQYIFRTVSTISPPSQLSFWRDYVCEKAWDLEYVYDAIIALGTVHRAVVLMSGSGNNDKMRGEDTAVVAMQAYTKALEGLADCFSQTNGANGAVVATLLLLAYFECFAGNIPAVYRHVRVANHYFSILSSTAAIKEKNTMSAIGSCLKRLNRLCRTAVPIPELGLPFQCLEVARIDATAMRPPCMVHFSTNCLCEALAEVFDLASSSPDIENMVWNPFSASYTSFSLGTIISLQNAVDDWTLSHSHISSVSYVRDGAPASTTAERAVFEALCFPPQPHAAVTYEACLIGALCEFYKARAAWALYAFEGEREKHELLAYLHCHRAMAWVETAKFSKIPRHTKDQRHTRLPCEMLAGGFLPILHLIGQMTPRSDWLHWIGEQMKDIGQEGLFDGKAFAKSIGALSVFEMCNNIDTSVTSERFPSPVARVLSVLVPESSGHGYTAYYVQPMAGMQPQEHGRVQYYSVGSARWSSRAEDAPKKSDLEFNREKQDLNDPCNDRWLGRQKAAQEWLVQSSDPSFSLDRALTDHTNGSLLSPAIHSIDEPE